MRIVSESTHVLHDESPTDDTEATSFSLNSPRLSNEPEDRRSGRAHTGGIFLHTIKPDVKLDSFLHLEPRHLESWNNANGEGGGSNFQDIHLAESVQEQDNMYMQIYGVPETWLSLVSQVTRLANVMDRLSLKQKRSDAEILVSLQPRASYLENAVCLFKSRYYSNPESLPDHVDGRGGTRDITPHTHMVRALSSAVVIFFYRRIRNVNPLVLQDSVNYVISSLHAFDEALERCGLLGPGTAWPAFIAGAEALTNGQRRSIISWLDKAFSKSGWMGYKASKDVLLELWRQRDDAGGTINSVTWMDICRRMNCWPLLS